MNAPKTIPPSLIRAYRNAHYFVHHGDEVLLLKVGNANSALGNLLKAYNCFTAAFLTAYNPYSQPCELSDNTKAHQDLVDALTQLGVKYVEGLGTDPNSDWDPEPSLLVLGISLSQAEQLADQFGQNAFLWIANPAGVVNLKLRHPIGNPTVLELAHWLENLPKPLQDTAQLISVDERNWIMSVNEDEQHHWLSPQTWDWNTPWPVAKPDGCAISVGTELDRMFKLTSSGLEKLYP